LEDKKKMYLVNKDIVEEKEVNLSINDRGYHFGDGIYEVIKVYDQKMFTVNEHINRLYESAKKIRLVIPYAKIELIKMLEKLIIVNELKDGHIYFQITRGVSERIHQFPDYTVEPVLTAFTKEMDRPLEKQKKGVKASLVEDERWLKCDIKSLNLLANVLAKQDATEKGSYEAILHRGDIVTEGSASNMFGIKNNVLYTHPANNLILHGITRGVIFKLAKQVGLTIKEEAMTVKELLQMEEVFLSSTTSEIMPIILIDEHQVGNGEVGKLTKEMQREFDNLIKEL
jgi:D-alanine transaminase